MFTEIKIKRGIQKAGTVLILLAPALLVALPVLILLSGSLMDAWELKGYLTTVFTDGNDFIRWKFLPDFPSFANYKKLLFETPQFFVLFWNSMKLVLGLCRIFFMSDLYVILCNSPSQKDCCVQHIRRGCKRRPTVLACAHLRRGESYSGTIM